METNDAQIFLHVNELLANETNLNIIKKELIKIEQELEQDKSVTELVSRIYTIKQIAILEELSGDWEKAQLYYYKAAKLTTGEEKAHFLFDLARLLTEQGFFAEAKENLDCIYQLSGDKELLAMSLNLDALIAYCEAEQEGANKKYQIILQDYKGTAGEIKALLGLVYLNLDNKAQAYIFLRQLEKIAPASPEFALAGKVFTESESNGTVNDSNNTIQFRFNPVIFFKSIEDGNGYGSRLPSLSPVSVQSSNPDTSFDPFVSSLNSSPAIIQQEEQGSLCSNEQTTGLENTDSIYVQTGSFSDKENADYMLSDLKKIGLQSVTVKKATIHNRIYYKVLIGPFENEERASIQLVKLKERGFEGFLLDE